MNADLAAAVLFVGGVIVLVVALGLTALGAWLWSNATAAAHRARAHGAEADARVTVDAAAIEAADAIPPMPQHYKPSDDEVREVILAARRAAAGNGRGTPHDDEEDHSTLGNEGAEPEHNAYEGRAFNL